VTSEIEIKTSRIAEILEQNQLDGVLLNGQHNFAWITGGGSNGIDLSRENGVASVLLTSKGERYLIANNIERRRLVDEEINAEHFTAVDFSWQNEKSGKQTALSIARDLAGVQIATDIPMFSGTEAIESKIAPCRHRLTAEEIDRTLGLCSDASTAMMNTITGSEAGVSEAAIANRLRSELGALGISSPVTLVAADERIGLYRHPVPTDNIWQRVLLLVTCAKRHGIVVSLSRIVCIGEVSDDLLKKTEAAASVNAHLLNATHEGATGRSIYQVAKNAYENVGYADEINLHHQGGAAGYRTREWVTHPESNDVVNTGQLFAWNPSITGTKVEETVLTTNDGIETLTTTEGFPTIETIVHGRSYFSPGILSI